MRFVGVILYHYVKFVIYFIDKQPHRRVLLIDISSAKCYYGYVRAFGVCGVINQ